VKKGQDSERGHFGSVTTYTANWERGPQKKKKRKREGGEAGWRSGKGKRSGATEIQNQIKKRKKEGGKGKKEKAPQAILMHRWENCVIHSQGGGVPHPRKKRGDVRSRKEGRGKVTLKKKKVVDSKKRERCRF